MLSAGYYLPPFIRSFLGEVYIVLAWKIMNGFVAFWIG